MNRSVAPAAEPVPPHRRKIHFVDHVLQMRLLVALVLLEIVVLSVAGYVLYRRLDAVVEASLYRVHLHDGPSMYASMMNVAFEVVGGMLLVNLLALVVADRLWARYVGRIVRSLRDELDLAKRLDFGAGTRPAAEHKVVALARAWREAEGARMKALRTSVSDLGAMIDRRDSTVAQRREALLACRRHLPPSA